MRKTLSCLFAGALPFVGIHAVASTEVVWTNVAPDSTSTGLSGRWGIAGNWTDAEGEPLAFAPTNGDYAVTLTPLPDSVSHKTVSTWMLTGGNGDEKYVDGATDVSITSIAGAHNYAVRHTEKSPSNQQLRKRRVFSVADPNSFFGWWETMNCMAEFELRATAGFVPVLYGLSTQYRPYVTVSDADTAAIVDVVAQGGFLDKLGAGKLSVGPTADSQIGYYVEAGELEIEGSCSGELEALLKEAELHLDAADETTFTYTTQEGFPDLQFVGEWRDKGGRDNAAAFIVPSVLGGQYHLPFVRPAFVAKDVSATGLRLIDFGSRCDESEATWGPSNCLMTLRKPLTDVRTAFCVECASHARAFTALSGEWRHSDMIDYMASTYIMCAQKQQRAEMRSGEFYKNGYPYGWKTEEFRMATLTKPFVLAMTSDIEGRVYMLGTDRGLMGSNGAGQIGEIILFNRVLNRKEIAVINRYLTGKWLTGLESTLDGSVALVSDGAALSVPKDRSMRLSDVVVRGGTLVKKGAGELVVGALHPADTAVRIEGGALKIASVVDEPSTNAPAADPYLWLDASEAEDFEEAPAGADSKTYVSAWKDHRTGSGLVATCRDDTGNGNRPFVVENAVNGHSVLSLGTVRGPYVAFPTWGENYDSGAKTDTAYAGFLVCCLNYDTPFDIMGSTDLTMYRSNSARGILDNSYRTRTSYSALWTLNGKPVEPTVAEDALPTFQRYGNYFLLAFRSTSPMTFNGIAKDRHSSWNTTYGGGLSIGECLVYHRPLSLKEFHDTEAYLMAKWLGQAHPSAHAEVIRQTGVVFSDSTPVVVDTDGKLVMDATAGGNGKVVKLGTGDAELTLAASGTADVRSVKVQGGTLTYDPAFSIDRHALYHFDATDEASLTTYPEDGKEYATEWRDTRKTGLKATSSQLLANISRLNQVAHTNPVVRTVETATGVSRQVLDFGRGRHCYATTGGEGGKGTPENPVTPWDNEAAMVFSQKFTTVREAYAVFADARTYGIKSGTYCYGYGQVFGCADTGYRHFHRNYSGAALFSNSIQGDIGSKMYSTNTNDTWISLDGKQVPYNQDPGTGFHLVGAATSNEFPSVINAFATERTFSGGGLLMGEQFAFDRRLTAIERAYVQDQMMHKWFGTAETVVWTNRMDEISIAAGATLNLGAKTVCVTDALSGGGTLVCAELQTGESAGLSVDFLAGGVCDGLKLSGRLSIAPGTVLTATCRCSRREVKFGDYPVLTAQGGLDGFENLEFETVGFPKGVVPSFVERDGIVYLRVAPTGALLIVR